VTRPIAILLATVAAATCGGERVRPAPLDPTEGPLQATITEPTANDSVAPGTATRIAVAGQDPLLRSLVGLGLVVRRIDGGAHVTLDSTVIQFSAREANAAVFDYTMPSTLPFGAIVNVYGLAFGSSQRAHESPPRSFFIENCDAGDCD
jgi:hypothetical protein